MSVVTSIAFRAFSNISSLDSELSVLLLPWVLAFSQMLLWFHSGSGQGCFQLAIATRILQRNDDVFHRLSSGWSPYSNQKKKSSQGELKVDAHHFRCHVFFIKHQISSPGFSAFHLNTQSTLPFHKSEIVAHNDFNPLLDFPRRFTQTFSCGSNRRHRKCTKIGWDWKRPSFLIW